MPRRPENYRRLPDADFRRLRHYLADEVFAVSPGASSPPTDSLDEETWDGVMALPTDVLLRTTDYQGSMLDDCHAQWAAWIHAMPWEPAVAPFAFEPALDVADELHASPFIAAHGWYRQATGGLRNALETMAISAAFSARADATQYKEWRDGRIGPKFGNAVDLLGQDDALKMIEVRLGGGALFGGAPDGVLRDLYARLSPFTHGRPGHTNADIWASNGPVWVWHGFRDFWIDFCDVVAVCYVLLKISWRDLELPDAAAPLFEAASERWHGCGSTAREWYFG